MRINNKGYLLVEIIVAFTIAMVMTFSLLQVVINLKDINEDYYVDTKLENDQTLMTKYVMDDINNYEISSISKDDNGVIFTFKYRDSEIVKKLSVDGRTFRYGEYILSSNSYKRNSTYTKFTKTFDNSLNVESPVIRVLCYRGSSYQTCSGSDSDEHKQINIKISAKTIYSDEDYGINLKIDYSNNEIEVTNTCQPISFSYSVIDSRYRGFNASQLSELDRRGITYMLDGEVGVDYSLQNNAKVLRIKNDGYLTITRDLDCDSNSIDVALVGGGQGGSCGRDSSWAGSHFGGGFYYIHGSRGAGGHGGGIYVVNNSLIEKGTFQISIATGGQTSCTDGALGDRTRNHNLNTVLKADSFTYNSSDGAFRNVGSSGREIVFDGISVGFYGSGGANGTICGHAFARGGDDNAGVGGYRNSRNGGAGKPNTGAGGGGGQGGCDCYGAPTESNGGLGGSGGNGGSGVVFLYYKNGWIHE